MDAWRQPESVRQVQRMLASYARWTGSELLADLGLGRVAGDALAVSGMVYRLPWVVVAHGSGSDPLFVYANHCAQTLWELDWPAFTQLPSRRSAAPGHVAERSGWLATAAAQGYVTGCHGERVSASGRRFLIEQVTIWNVLDASGAAQGQAAAYRSWRYLG
jgi:MEKHLA domain